MEIIYGSVFFLNNRFGFFSLKFWQKPELRDAVTRLYAKYKGPVLDITDSVQVSVNLFLFT